MAGERLGVGVIGAGRWANWAHLPGWKRDERCEIVAVCDTDIDRAKAAADRFGAKVVTADYADLLARDDIAIIDVVTRDSGHFEINMAAWKLASTCSARNRSRTTSAMSVGPPISRPPMA